ncbi:uncharacterized protein Z518_01766 [Rhinocladiella mackenziei CBS 650.93]|uniref:Uncharacterized protein n=1 Tax=Rhinocladiella mackenziei CBS 650.93 TaxID=1442369 RepID=A0A0D2G6T9_9EURO|nr:uncharacterized protein Z518_01766 [Rhinocladiella mackenziei CBS 650.93]KIX10682.1 hypothetical protein Z518_01766 [Rhinocladiella mackenziei CBS 650.93]
MADGYARLTGKAQCVIVHVDVGTQALGAAVHNASCGRCPVLIFAGLSPYTIEGEILGSRTEFIHWIQDVPEQRQIVAQYCRYTAELKTGKNIKQMVNRAIQFATSDPAGPVYLVAAREVMEEVINPYPVRQDVWKPVKSGALPQHAVELIASNLVHAKEPLLITGYSGRNHDTVKELVKLADAVPGLGVVDMAGTDVCFPFSHRSSLGLGFSNHESVRTADVIIVVNCDVPWIPTQCTPRSDAKIIHIDVDPLKQMMPVFYIAATHRYRADAETALYQLHTYIARDETCREILQSEASSHKWQALADSHAKQLAIFRDFARSPVDTNHAPSASYLCDQLRRTCPQDTIWCVEAVTNSHWVSQQLQVDIPGHWINCGGGGLGWSGGASLGIKLASDALHGGRGKGKFVCQIVGDGSYMFTVPSSVYWIAEKYEIPTLTIVLNNKGWNSPRRSMLLVHPNGSGSKATNEELAISFDPSPDYAGIAWAASGHKCWAGCVKSVKELAKLLPEAISSVKAGIGAVLEVRLVDAFPSEPQGREHLTNGA